MAAHGASPAPPRPDCVCGLPRLKPLLPPPQSTPVPTLPGLSLRSEPRVALRVLPPLRTLPARPAYTLCGFSLIASRSNLEK